MPTSSNLATRQQAHLIQLGYQTTCPPHPTWLPNYCIPTLSNLATILHAHLIQLGCLNTTCPSHPTWLPDYMPTSSNLATTLHAHLIQLGYQTTCPPHPTWLPEYCMPISSNLATRLHAHLIQLSFQTTWPPHSTWLLDYMPTSWKPLATVLRTRWWGSLHKLVMVGNNSLLNCLAPTNVTIAWNEKNQAHSHETKWVKQALWPHQTWIFNKSPKDAHFSFFALVHQNKQVNEIKQKAEEENKLYISTEEMITDLWH